MYISRYRFDSSVQTADDTGNQSNAELLRILDHLYHYVSIQHSFMMSHSFPFPFLIQKSKDWYQFKFFQKHYVLHHTIRLKFVLPIDLQRSVEYQDLVYFLQHPRRFFY